MRLLNAEIIAVGSELLTASKVDTNSLWLTDQLNTLGVEVVAKAIIGDDRSRLSQAVQAAAARSAIVVITGGLGPTEDDVTRDAVAAAFERGQEFRQELLDQIAARFRRLNRPMAENNRRQAFLVEGAEALPNDRGTAPGQWIESGGAVVMLLPGPPREMQAMFELQCLPRLQQIVPVSVIRTRFYRVAGMGESDCDQLIAPVYTKYSNPVTTILAAPGDIQLHLRARCATAEEADALLADLGSQIEGLLGDRLYTATGDSLEAVVGDLLAARSETVCVAESLTGGLLGGRLSAMPGSSRYFRGGFVAYTNELKTALLGVDPALIAEHTAVSDPVARAMAIGARDRLGATWALAATGYAGPDGGDGANPPGTVYIGLAGPESVTALRFHLGFDRERVRLFATIWALDLLRKTLLSAATQK